jgi:CBS domain-containing protein
MRIREIMTSDPVCCVPQTSLPEAARLMLQNDCGAIPVLEDDRSRRPIGVVTDRDIACRVVAQTRNPVGMRVRDCMTTPAVTVAADSPIEECCRLLEQKRIRRAVVVDGQGNCCGIVSQADIALAAPAEQTGRVVREVSQPRSHAGRKNGAVSQPVQTGGLLDGLLSLTARWGWQKAAK